MLAASVIIPNLHSPHLGAVLAALAQQTVPPLEVLVVGQDCYGFARRHPHAAFITTPRPVWPALARNIGLAHSRGAVCCFLDADCIPCPTWLEKLLAAVQQGHTAVGGGIALGRETLSFWQRCDNIVLMGAFLQTAPPGERPFLLTANLALRREVVQRAGLLNTSLRAGEDVELSFRLRQQGERLWFAPAALVQHQTCRGTAAAVWQHIAGYAPYWLRLRDMYGSWSGLSCWHVLARRLPWLAWLLLPLFALRDIARLYAAQPALLRQPWPTLPAVCWIRTAWYVGQLQALYRQSEGAV